MNIFKHLKVIREHKKRVRDMLIKRNIGILRLDWKTLAKQQQMYIRVLLTPRISCGRTQVPLSVMHGIGRLISRKKTAKLL